jgi:hypothetical protein
MLSSGEIAKIRAEIKRLEKARENCNDGGIQKRIEAWIKEQKHRPDRIVRLVELLLVTRSLPLL